MLVQQHFYQSERSRLALHAFEGSQRETIQNQKGALSKHTWAAIYCPEPDRWLSVHDATCKPPLRGRGGDT